MFRFLVVFFFFSSVTYYDEKVIMMKMIPVVVKVLIYNGYFITNMVYTNTQYLYWVTIKNRSRETKQTEQKSTTQKKSPLNPIQDRDTWIFHRRFFILTDKTTLNLKKQKNKRNSVNHLSMLESLPVTCPCISMFLAGLDG